MQALRFPDDVQDPDVRRPAAGGRALKPTRITRDSPQVLLIEWDDNHRGRHMLATLRSSCPCASCKTDSEDSGGMVMLPVLTPGQNELVQIEPVGAYALQFIWKDGHRTGIYSYDFLRELCECEECAAGRKV